MITFGCFAFGGFGGLFGETIIIKNSKMISTNSSGIYGQNGDHESSGIGGFGGFFGDTAIRGKLK